MRRAVQTPALPAGTRLYAVGDIHGRDDLLAELQARIAADAEGSRARRPVLLYIGDYIDRGPDSKAVLDRLVDRPLAGFETIHLMGNHEALALEFLEDPGVGPLWFSNGGDATLLSYGVDPLQRAGPARAPYRALRDAFAAALPERHLAFLRGLRLSHAEGDYLFVHAGIRPGVPLERQSPEDLLWIRREFLDSEADHGKVVVHGHSIARQPERRPNRIGIDTGAFATGRLTALVLEGTEAGFLQT